MSSLRAKFIALLDGLILDYKCNRTANRLKTKSAMSHGSKQIILQIPVGATSELYVLNSTDEQYYKTKKKDCPGGNLSIQLIK